LYDPSVASEPGGFQVDAILGEGSTSMVVLARPNGEDRHVVVKVLQRELLRHDEIMARTRDEARLLALITHPHVVTVEALVVHHGHPLVVMEYVDGLDLGTLLRATAAPLPPGDAAEVARRTAEALHAANTAPSPDDPERPLRVIHRDIKPSNLLLTVDGQIKVLDFGLARAEFAEREARTDAFVLGSMGFVAPERYDVLASTPAVDVYALGVTWFQLLTAHTLVLPRTADRHDVERDKQFAKMPLPDVPDDTATTLVALMTEMCAFAPADRPAAGEVAERIAALGLPSDLPGLAARRIPEARAKRPPLSPHDHPAWAELAFLERPERTGTGRRPLERLLQWIGLRS
jgi:serine/threonine-protein kinase